MRRWIRRAAALAVLSLALAQPASPASQHHLSGGGTATLSQVAMNVWISDSGTASGSFECLMAGRSAFAIAGFGLAHNMIVHGSPTAGSVSGTVVTFSGPARLTLDGKTKMDVQISVKVDVSTQSFQLIAIGVATIDTETMVSGHLSLR